MTDAPRENLVRANFTERAEVEGRTMTGYPVIFETWTEINSWEGRFKERIAPGALNRTLQNNGDQIKVLFNHGMDPSIGDKPLGRATELRVDGRGLYVEVPMSETSYNDDLIALMRDGALDGMSFRFSVPEGKDSWEYPKKGLPERTINELRLFEFGPVTFPAYQATTVGIRSRDLFEAWVGLNDERRDRVARLMGVDLRTLSSELAEGTSDLGLATQGTPDPLGAHSGDPNRIRRAHAAAYALQEYTK